MTTAETAGQEEPWSAQIDKEIASDKDEGIPSTLPSILRDLIVVYPQDGPPAAQEAARHVDADFWDAYLPWDQTQGAGRDGAAGINFLARLYQVTLSIVRFIPYDDSRQDALIQLLLELRKLAPRPGKVSSMTLLH